MEQAMPKSVKAITFFERIVFDLMAICGRVSTFEVLTAIRLRLRHWCMRV